VVKRGSLGATVITSSEIRNIPAYRTQRVWPVGSGDVFAAVFAFYWASDKTDPFTAASRASLATAYYCDTKRLPIPTNFTEQAKYQPIEKKNDFPLSPKQVYLAGPFFTMAERWVINQAREYLMEQGFKVFSPLHDIGFGTAMEVAPADIEGLKHSDIVFALLDGLDAGTVFEIGYARSHYKPVVVFVQNESDESLKMLAGTNCEIVNDFVSAIYRTVWAAMQI
jgi:nucleoside 2-deoxyribosyltransferase